ncbi:hypothetical protein [Mycolicibacterium brumae]|uniref:Transmembrane protein n=1 Tax=Mycolicibacterium brumae TaxID=85968 RepID=A0A2G5PF20_9MYCO|nr:hypothetical protein [Mycolicibacterium brumae]MCV7191622.1 hypothetical protein [Mycolicibacterium brumae]PIB76922.1 hypothetical protein CQY22_004620 [Mycolicibacterium brumae]RWA20524.1 hypothetical protein MBRU_02375 [Mycolicibacterium brumae DSM 44177]UWW07621.1 hypothetical protein L2Z93_000643 [Mycolicibacterium brumae]
MIRLNPGWLVVACATVLAASCWLPWLVSGEFGRVSAIGGTGGGMTVAPGFGIGQTIALLASALLVAGAMTARGLLRIVAASAALGLGVLLNVLIWRYHHLGVGGEVSAGFGFHIAAGAAGVAAALSVWALVEAIIARRA